MFGMNTEKAPPEDSEALCVSSPSPGGVHSSEEFDGIPDEFEKQPDSYVKQVPDSKHDAHHFSLLARLFGIKSTWDLAWLSIAIVAIIIGIVLALSDLIPGQDPSAQMNALLLGLLAAGWATSMCSEIKTRWWGTGFSVAGIAIWAMDVVYGADGDIGALWDVFCRGAGCR